MEIKYHSDSSGNFVAEVHHPIHGHIYQTDGFSKSDLAISAAQSWIHWFTNAPMGKAESIYYILSVPETWPGPPPNSHSYSGLHVKIGIAKNVKKRLLNLQTGATGKLILHALEPGSHEIERARHQQFEIDRRQGEWFSCSPELTRHIISTWERNRLLPSDHQKEVLMLLDRIKILKGVRSVFEGPPDMINPSLRETWHGKVFLDLVYANRRPK